MYTPVNIKRSEKYGSNYWEVLSPKTARIVRFFSDLEYEHYILVETNPSIITFCEQPLRICCNLNGQRVESIFDMWIKYKDGTECFIETKYLSELDHHNPKSERSIRQTRAQRLWCDENGFNYNIRTEADIRGNPVFLTNMKTVLSYIKRNMQPIETDALYIKKNISASRASINQIGILLPEMALERIKESIAWMIYQGSAATNIDTVEFGIQTEVWLNAE